MTRGLAAHARALMLAVILLTLGGVVAATRLPVGLFPHIDYPRVVVSVDAGDRDADQMAAEITRPIEIALRAVPGVERRNGDLVLRPSVAAAGPHGESDDRGEHRGGPEAHSRNSSRSVEAGLKSALRLSGGRG